MAIAGLSAFCDMLSQTPVSLWVQTTSWVIPAVQSIHILAIAAVMASIWMLNLRLTGLIGRHVSARVMARRFLPAVWWALPVLLVTGLIMIVGEPARELLSRFFWYKMTMLVMVVLLTIPLSHLVEDRPVAGHAPARRASVRLIAAGSLMLWVGIVFCGRWIAYA